MACEKATPQTPKFLQKLQKNMLEGFAEVKALIDVMANKVDACTAAIAALQAEQKRILVGLSDVPKQTVIEMDDDFVKLIKDSFPLKDQKTLERFNAELSDPQNVLTFIKYMTDLHIKDSGICDGKRLVRNFNDHFFTRKFMLQVNRTGNRRSYGPPKVKLESYENILQTFHKCIRVGVPSFGYEGTKKALWKLCDTAVQRYKEVAVDEVQYEESERIDDADLNRNASHDEEINLSENDFSLNADDMT